MKLSLELYDKKITIESSNNDYSSKELLETFSQMLVCAGYGPEVITLKDGGRYQCEYVEEENNGTI